MVDNGSSALPKMARDATNAKPTKAPTSRREACHYFALGKCRNGLNCPFYHGPREEYAVSAYPCKYFLMNTCKAGRDCKFSHVIPDGMQSMNRSTGQKEVAPGSIKVLCRFFNDTGCSMGGKCPYLHVPEPAGDIAKDAARKKPPVASHRHVKMYSLTRKPAAVAVATTATATATATAAAAAAVAEDVDEELKKEFFGFVEEQQVTHLSDFISKEEEVYYYGAPGEMEDTRGMVAATSNQSQLNPSISYSQATKKNLPPTPPMQPYESAAPPKKCHFFFHGGCRYGDTCFYSHDDLLDEEPDMELAAARSLSEEMKGGDAYAEHDDENQPFQSHQDEDPQQHQHQQQHEEEVEEEMNQNEFECNICYEHILAKGERFGILSGCDHTFCLSCVRNWRGNVHQPKQTVRACPVCRVETHFIIPSIRMVTDPEAKRQLMESYRRNVSTIPCRHFDRGRGNCPFGSSCFYEHRLENGTLADRSVRTAVNSQGDYDVLGQVRLGHFLQ